MRRNRTLLIHTQGGKKAVVATVSKCAQMLGLLDKHFKWVIVSKYRHLMKNMVCMSDQIWNLNSEMETIKKKQLEI